MCLALSKYERSPAASSPPCYHPLDKASIAEKVETRLQLTEGGNVGASGEVSLLEGAVDVGEGLEDSSGRTLERLAVGTVFQADVHVAHQQHTPTS